jgi:hypothetical protein
LAQIVEGSLSTESGYRGLNICASIVVAANLDACDGRDAK